MSESNGELSPQTPLILRAWQGGLPLWQTFWLGLVLTTLAMSGLLRMVVVEFLFPLSVRNALLGFFVFALAILVFLWIAVWRSAARSSLTARIAARAVVVFHAVWFVAKFGAYLGIYGSLV
jgi:hypothetical protein